MSNSWKILRSKSLYDEFLNYNLSSDEKILTVDWEIKNGQVVKETDLEEALVWRSLWENEVNSIFKKYDYLALPVAQVYPFNKDISYPSNINGKTNGDISSVDGYCGFIKYSGAANYLRSCGFK